MQFMLFMCRQDRQEPHYYQNKKTDNLCLTKGHQMNKLWGQRQSKDFIFSFEPRPPSEPTFPTLCGNQWLHRAAKRLDFLRAVLQNKHKAILHGLAASQTPLLCPVPTRVKVQVIIFFPFT